MKDKPKKSAGLLLFRRREAAIEVLLAHMGGPFWAHKDDGSWSIPKGEFEDEAPLDAAIREFQEETGMTASGHFLELSPVKQPSGKTVFAWALESDCDATKVKSNTFAMEWPKGSGLMRDFPEIDRASWFSMSEARRKLLKGQVPLLDQLQKVLGMASPGAESARPSAEEERGPKAQQKEQLSLF
jgi:predicted NUDIX family NTP pyrophosphohydrolase